MTKSGPSQETGSKVNEWWGSAVVYQVYPRSFADHNGDGVGDLRGIISRLDYLAELSVDAIWMSPCFRSPQRDHGYDVADYFDIDPLFGSLDDLDELVTQARRRGIRIVLDIVPNHCSTDHPLFKAAVKAGRGSAERELFYFRDGSSSVPSVESGDEGVQPPNNWLSLFGGSAWERVAEPDGSPGQWYLHVFDAGQPDFNWEHPEVQRHFDEVLTFWLDRGVEGFRVDAVTVVGKTPGLPEGPTPPEGLPAAHAAGMNRHFQRHDIARAYWARWRGVLDRYQAEHPGREPFTICEAYIPRRPDLLRGYVSDDQFHQSFAFDLMLTPWVAGAVKKSITSYIDEVVSHGGALAWTLNNHDTHRSVTRYGRADAATMESWTGNNLVYTNTSVDADLGERRSRAMAVFAAALPGAFYVYQGEELGLPEVLDISDERRQDPMFHRTHGREKGRDGCRVPLPWDNNPANAFGFSRSTDNPTAEVAPWLPQPDDWGRHSVSELSTRAGSTLNMYRDLLRARRENFSRESNAHEDPDLTRVRRDREQSVLDQPDFEWLDDPHPDVIAYRRSQVGAIIDIVIDVIINMGDQAHRIDMLTPETRIIVSSVPDALDGNMLAPNAAVWIGQSLPLR